MTKLATFLIVFFMYLSFDSWHHIAELKESMAADCCNGKKKEVKKETLRSANKVELADSVLAAMKKLDRKIEKAKKKKDGV